MPDNAFISSQVLQKVVMRRNWSPYQKFCLFKVFEKFINALPSTDLRSFIELLNYPFNFKNLVMYIENIIEFYVLEFLIKPNPLINITHLLDSLVFRAYFVIVENLNSILTQHILYILS